jgi:DNA (cytosine-5)-methyltransferase 1
VTQALVSHPLEGRFSSDANAHWPSGSDDHLPNQPESHSLPGSPSPYRVLSLFAGIGGFDLGLERTGGFKTVAFCEIEPFCQRVLAKHWPGVPIYDDVRNLSGERLAADGIGVDVIAGGFPCQGVSEAGLRQGLQDPRSGLWREYARLIGEIRPRYVVVENVSELLRHGYGMGEVLGDLAQIGYDAEWHSIPALAIGADHIRERIWIVAYPDRSGAQEPEQRGREQRQAQVGEDAPQDHADADGARLQGWLSARAISEDARNISPWLGLAISAAAPFPGVDGAGPPVLGRGEDGIPGRMDRVHAIGNAVVPQIPTLIGRAILAADTGALAVNGAAPGFGHGSSARKPAKHNVPNSSLPIQSDS